MDFPLKLRENQYVDLETLTETRVILENKDVLELNLIQTSI